ncbi:hypothetical protein PCANC_16535 [Puccinia coronata f. sp. avenae]|uniref:F-BAR domain-containing protein n=1 Tax=Puccinia coronata f. sp. avenae TaxID=200324 RepID=A0A2N5ULH5_9BASI|nr:hypothetical protein PCANC_16535 [Puccinia coronata f. sp. avenae]
MARLANLFNKAHPQFPNGSQEHAYHHGPSSPTRLQVDAASSPHVHRSQAPHHPPYESQDFCNAFWGDIGYEVLMSRVKQSSRMLDDLKTWYKERSAIELEYSKKLFRLSKSPVLSQATANYEPNGLKAALESVRQSTEKMAHCHAELSGTFRTALYGKFDTFINTRDSAKKNPQATVEKLRKILVDLHVIHEKARRKFESDAIATNGYVTQLQLVQGRDSDKVSNKLDKVNMSIKLTEKEYRTHNKNLQDTINQWNTEWKLFCDLAQDLEEDRIDFVRNTFWDYANAVSAICVANDEQCEHIRQSLEHCEASKDVRSYVRHAATGNEYSLAPSFVNYIAGEIPRPVTVLTANFIRTSTRKPEDTTLVALSKPLQGMVQSIQAGPPLAPAADTHGRNAPTAWEHKNKIKRGGAIADAVASMSLNSSLQNSGSIKPGRPVDLTADSLHHHQRLLLRDSTNFVNQPGPGYPSHQQSYQPPQHSPPTAAPHSRPQPNHHPSTDHQNLTHPNIDLQKSREILPHHPENKTYAPLPRVNLIDRPLPPPPPI